MQAARRGSTSGSFAVSVVVGGVVRADLYCSTRARVVVNMGFSCLDIVRVVGRPMAVVWRWLL